MCNIKKEDIISAPDLEVIYELPLIFEKQNFGNKILEKLSLPKKSSKLKKWENWLII